MMNDSSDSTDPKRVVERGYDQAAQDYARLEAGTTWPRMAWLKMLLGKLEPGCTILDLGCGSGDPADIEMAKTHQVTGVDISRSQIEMARRNVPTGQFMHGDIGSVEFPAASFDAVVCFYALEHIPREEHGTIFRRIHYWLGPAGFLLLSTEAGEASGVIGQWLGVPMYFSGFEPETVCDLVREAGFELIETEIEKQLEGGLAPFDCHNIDIHNSHHPIRSFDLAVFDIVRQYNGLVFAPQRSMPERLRISRHQPQEKSLSH